MEKFLRIKWENIFAIITGSILISMTIKFIVIFGFNLDTLMFEIAYTVLSIILIRWVVGTSRRMFLEDEKRENN